MKKIMTTLTWLVFILSFLTVSCIPGLRQKTPERELVIFPAPPDTARIQFLTSFSNSGEIAGKRSAFSTYVLGEAPEQEIVKPYGLAVAGGKIYICDTMLGGLEIVDLAKNRFAYFTPGGLGQLKKPINCCVDEAGFLYVADSERRQVVVFDPEGRYQGSIGGEELARPTDVAVHRDQIWIADIKKQQVLVYGKADYRLLRTLPEAAPQTPGHLYLPTNLAIINDQLYVSDFGDFKIKIYSLSGQFLSSVGSYGRQLGQFVRPKGIAVDREGNLYVVDAGFENIQMFDAENRLLMFFGGNSQGPGGMWLPAKVVIDYDHLQYFQKYVDKRFNLKHLIFVTNQYGPDKINVYGFVEARDK